MGDRDRPGGREAKRQGGQAVGRPGGREARRQEARWQGGQAAGRPGGREARRQGGQAAGGPARKVTKALTRTGQLLNRHVPVPPNHPKSGGPRASPL